MICKQRGDHRTILDVVFLTVHTGELTVHAVKSQIPGHITFHAEQLTHEELESTT